MPKFFTAGTAAKLDEGFISKAIGDTLDKFAESEVALGGSGGSLMPAPAKGGCCSPQAGLFVWPPNLAPGTELIRPRARSQRSHSRPEHLPARHSSGRPNRRIFVKQFAVNEKFNRRK